MGPRVIGVESEDHLVRELREVGDPRATSQVSVLTAESVHCCCPRAGAAHCQERWEGRKESFGRWKM